MIYEAPLITRGYSLPNGHLIPTRGYGYSLFSIGKELKKITSLINKSALLISQIVLRIKRNGLVDIKEVRDSEI